jgi:hypothetical protein
MLLTVALCLILQPAGGAKPPQVVSIYVGPQARDGFVDTDKGVLESIAHIQKELRKSPGLRVVDDERAAAVSLYVLSRGIGPTAGGTAINIPIGATSMSFFVPANSRHVETLLRVGSYERPFVVEDHEYDSWKKCGQMIAKDVSVWLTANRERINAGTPPASIK